MNFKEIMKEQASFVDEALDQLLPAKEAYPPIIYEAMRYSLFSGGKRLRPILVLAAAEAVGGDPKQCIDAACALEMIHTYSLVHDDLPAMDDDDYRRGRLTCHKVYGDDIAILAGDALLTLAFQVLAEMKGVPDKILEVIKEISIAAGTMGMIGGQVVDMESEHKRIDAETLKYIHASKTGALYRAALRAGGILGGAGQDELNALTTYAENLGLAFQITDDILDIEGDEKILGKPVGSDIRNEKSTYPSLYGLEQAKFMAREAVEKANGALDIFGDRAWLLKEICLYLLKRDH